ncbi:MAG: DUF4173 domain-containing protein [Actinomycetota bacterium]
MTSTLPPPPSAAEREFRPGLDDRWRIRAGSSVLVGVALGGVAFDVGVRHPVGIASLAAACLAVAACRVGGWTVGARSRRLLGAALIPAAFLVWRDSDWLVPLNVVATVGLLALAMAVRDEEHALARAIGRLLRPDSAIEPAVRGGDLVLRSAKAVGAGRRTTRDRAVRAVRGVAIAAPIAAALLGLLAASDALLRSWLDVPFDGESALSHVFVVVIGAGLTAGLAGHGGWKHTAEPIVAPRGLGRTEATLVLGAVVAVYTAFVIAQVIAIAGGGSYVLDTTGLTYAEYARAGFFQLVAAAVLTLLVLVALTALTSRDARERPQVRVLELTTVALTLITVAVAIRRLFLYETEFGLTMLRLYTIVFAGFIGAVFLVVGLALRGVSRVHPLTTVAAIGFGVLITMNLANPEAIVAERNIDRFGGTDALDIDYLTEHLGNDAIPTLMGDATVAAALCATEPMVDDRLAVYNHSRAAAVRALERC